MFRRTTSRCLIVLLVTAFALRVAAAVVVERLRPAGQVCLIAGDADGYWELAQRLVAGQDYAIYQPPRYVLRMPGFPLLLAAGIEITGGHLLAIRVLLAAVGTAGCGMVYLLGRELVDETVGLIAAACAAASPALAGFSVLLLSETLFGVTLTASLAAAAWMLRLPGGSTARAWAAAALTGFLMAVACFARPSWLLFAPALVAIAFAARVGHADWLPWRCLLSRGTVLLGAMALCFVPWIVRNYRVTGRFVPTTLWMGPSLYDGLNPHATGESDMRFIEDDGLYQQMSEYQVDRHYRDAAWKFAESHPARSAWLALVKLWKFWRPWPNPEQFRSAAVWIIAAWFVALVALAVMGMFASQPARLSRGWLIVLSLGPMVYFSALHMVFVSSFRYRLPAEYPLCVLTAVGIDVIWKRWQAGRGSVPATR
jgi:hypothetical protein